MTQATERLVKKLTIYDNILDIEKTNEVLKLQFDKHLKLEHHMVKLKLSKLRSQPIEVSAVSLRE